MAHGLEEEYTIVVSSRQPREAQPPIITEIGELTPTGAISYADELNQDGEASFSVEPEAVEPTIGARLKDLDSNPTEISIFRGSSLVWGGPLISCQQQGPTLTLNARGFLYYLRYMALEHDRFFTGFDQWQIVKSLIIYYQDLAWGNYGIDTSPIGNSGINRDRAYPLEENHPIYDRVNQLAEIDDGFEYWIDPSDRKFHIAVTKGNDKTMSVFADEVNIIDPNVFWSVAHDSIANSSVAIGISSNADVPFVIGKKENADLMSKFGRVTRIRTFDGVTSQATIDGHAQFMVDSRATQELVPGPAVLPIEGILPTDYDVGDTVTYAIRIGNLGVLKTERRIRFKRVRTDEEGAESMTWELL